MSEERIDLDRTAFNTTVRSLSEIAQQLCKARDDTYHRARAEAEAEILRKVIRDVFGMLIDEIGER